MRGIQFGFVDSLRIRRPFQRLPTRRDQAHSSAWGVPRTFVILVKFQIILAEPISTFAPENPRIGRRGSRSYALHRSEGGVQWWILIAVLRTLPHLTRKDRVRR